MTVSAEQLAELIAQTKAAARNETIGAATGAAMLAKLRTPTQPVAKLCSVCYEPTHPTLDEPTHPTCEWLPLDQEVRRIVAYADANAARNMQRTIGPSEIGNQCDRFIAYKMLDIDPVNTGGDNWLAILGTAAHAWLADAFETDNRRLGRRRWLIEERVWITDGISGSCDGYDTDRHAVFDHKVKGNTKLKAIRDTGEIDPEYRVQLHLYGYGHERAGRKVETVNLIVYPRNDSLRGDYGGNKLHVWTEPYNRQVAVDALDRLERVTTLAATLHADEHPDRFEAIPAHPSDGCKFCPFYKPGGESADDTGCPGMGVKPIPDRIPGLIA